MQLNSYAKINIGLRIVSKRLDGFHNIETFFQQIDLHDTLCIETAEDGQITLQTSGRDCPSDSTNLAHRAAELLRETIGDRSLGCRIELTKRIPIGAGLGGGSSNAGVTLAALRQLWPNALSRQDIAACAARLGSDVPFFLQGGFALGEGKGDILTAIAAKLDYFGLLVYPHIHLSTAWVYRNFNLTRKNKIAKFKSFIPKISKQHLWRKELGNDLTQVVFAKHPEFASIVDQFYDCGAFYAQMSGSGSTFFGLFAERTQARRAAHLFRERYETIPFIPISL
ncbi:4-(cytidine 5'-diphospho)-2-C-methyl-D-erythritol kinase [candidate division KSB1 bacterium]|nr:4-(cytidine 5'-diphospho)-2-C-methyl-D-erythritol kinase [candidate division KSB1 bacterium]RQW10225.1 MAG: 4-(cytidine 5'-diphospho)-2-C-methyl-D-erythritol kinase [candidate division KSB1 bacterium]